MVTKLLILVHLSAAQKEFGGGEVDYTIGKTVEEECADVPLSFYDELANACLPCEPYSYADASGRACEAETCIDNQALNIEGKCYFCDWYSYPKDNL